MQYALPVHWTVYTLYRYLGQKYLFVSANDVGLMESKIWKTNLAEMVLFLLPSRGSRISQTLQTPNTGLPF